MAGIQIGKWQYGRADMPMYGKLLSFLQNHKQGTTVPMLCKRPEILKAFGGEEVRAVTKMNVMLRNLKFRGVTTEFLNGSEVIHKVVNLVDSAEIIKAAKEIENSIQRRTAEAADGIEVSAVASTNSNSAKVKKMSTEKKAKIVRMFRDPTDNTVKPFGIGRPSKAKIACEVSADGKYVNAKAAMEFMSAGKAATSLDKLKKAELVELVGKLQDENKSLTVLVDALREALAAVMPVDADAADTTDDSDADLTVDADEADSIDDLVEAVVAE